MEAPRKEEAAAPSWMICPLQRPHAPGSASCMADWRAGCPCTLSACAVYREILAARSQIDWLAERLTTTQRLLAEERKIAESLREHDVCPMQEAPHSTT